MAKMRGRTLALALTPIALGVCAFSLPVLMRHARVADAVRGLDSPDSDAASAAFDRIVELGGWELVTDVFVERARTHRNPEERRDAAVVLAWCTFYHPQLLTVLVEHAESEDVLIRVNAMECLAHTLEEHPERFDVRCEAALIRRLREGGSGDTDYMQSLAIEGLAFAGGMSVLPELKRVAIAGGVRAEQAAFAMAHILSRNDSRFSAKLEHLADYGMYGRFDALIPEFVATVIGMVPDAPANSTSP